jgi:hypothetical protein
VEPGLRPPDPTQAPRYISAGTAAVCGSKEEGIARTASRRIVPENAFALERVELG